MTEWHIKQLLTTTVQRDLPLQLYASCSAVADVFLCCRIDFRTDVVGTDTLGCLVPALSPMFCRKDTDFVIYLACWHAQLSRAKVIPSWDHLITQLPDGESVYWPKGFCALLQYVSTISHCVWLTNYVTGQKQQLTPSMSSINCTSSLSLLLLCLSCWTSGWNSQVERLAREGVYTQE